MFEKPRRTEQKRMPENYLYAGVIYYLMKINYLFISILVIAILSGCIGSKDKIYPVEEVYQNPDAFKDKKGNWNIISIQGIAGTDAVYEVEVNNPNSYYFLAPDIKNRQPNEIIYVSTANGAPKAGSKAVVKGKIEKVVEAGKIRIVMFIPVKE